MDELSKRPCGTTASELIRRQHTRTERGALIACGVLMLLGIGLFLTNSWRDAYGLSAAYVSTEDWEWLRWSIRYEPVIAALLTVIAWFKSRKSLLTFRGITTLLLLYATVPALSAAVLAVLYCLTTGMPLALRTPAGSWAVFLLAWGAGYLLGLGTSRHS